MKSKDTTDINIDTIHLGEIGKDSAGRSKIHTAYNNMIKGWF